MSEVYTSESSNDDRINELYWNSDRTVDEIVEELGIGRNTLYSSVRPQPVGASCPDCVGNMVFTNRSNRSSGTAACGSCGLEMDLADREPEAEIVHSGSDLGSHGHDHRDGNGGWSRWREDLAAVAPERAAMIGGAAALGVVFGAVAARAVREMR